jgi:hypothetical protein
MPKVSRGDYCGSLPRHGVSLRVTIGTLFISPATIRLVGNDFRPKGRVHSSDEMEQNIIIYIGIWNALSIVASVVLGAWYAAYRLGRVETKLTALENNVSRLTGRVDNLYGARLPMGKRPKGK